MTELVGLVTSGPALAGYGLGLLVFGFAPGFLLRLIVRFYPSGDPRRRELVAELYAMRRIWRPMWVVQQLECGLFEGLGARHRARHRAREQRLNRDLTRTVKYVWSRSLEGWARREPGARIEERIRVRHRTDDLGNVVETDIDIDDVPVQRAGRRRRR